MGSIKDAERNKMLDAYVGRTTYTANAAFYIQLHTGDPGAAGTANVAGEADRMASTFGSGATGGAISNTANVEWTNVAATEVYTWVSAWTASTSGTHLGNDQITDASVTAGDTFRIPSGDLDITIT